MPHQVIKGKNWHTYKGVRYDVDTFYDELAWEEILFLDKRLVHRTWFFTRSDFPCPNCQSHVDIHFNIQSTGVVMKCEYCQLTTLSLPYRAGDSGEEGEIAELLKTEEVTVQEALKIAERTGSDVEFLAPYIQRPRPRARHVHNSDEEKIMRKGGE